MKSLTPYLFFNGNCREAMTFYKTCFGGNLEIMTNSDAPKDACSSEMKLASDQILHACLTNGDFVLMASDNPRDKPKTGDNLSITINCTSVQQTDELFKALSKDGNVTMPLDDTFWGAHFGTLIDKYGFHWMLNCPLESDKSK